LQVDGIRNCCVVYNQNKKEITLFYECDQEHAAAFMREKLSASLPKYMLPTVFNRMDQMPRNPNGKIDRAKLVASVN
jgi:acyl-CoA synthetase (AMP-forming)/AMP-acid ligase II